MLATYEESTCKLLPFRFLIESCLTVCNAYPPSFSRGRKVIRLLHPDKHGGLDASESELMELTKLFTVLSESYNSYKSSLDPL